MRFLILQLILIFVLLSMSHTIKTQTCGELLDQANLMHQAQNLDSAIALSKISLKKAEQEYGYNDTTVAMALNRLSRYYYLQANYSEAAKIKKRSLDIIDKALGKECPKWYSVLNGLADIYQAQARYAEAEHLYKQVLAGKEKLFGPATDNVAYVLNHLAQLYRRTGRLDEAERLITRALSIYDELENPYFFIVSQSYHQLALIYRQQGKIGKAIQMEKQALAIRESNFGLEHYEVASCLNDLANFYMQSGDYREAELLQRRSLAIMEKTLGPKHPWVAFSLNDLANIYKSLGNYSEAELYSGRALTLIKDTLGQEHPDIAIIQNNLGVIYRNQKEFAKAEQHFRQALSIREKRLGLNHYYVAETLEEYSQLLLLQERTNEALKLAKRACQIRQNNFTDNAFALTETDALTYSQFLRNSIDNYLSCYSKLDPVDPATTTAAADIILSNKGQVSDGIFERRKAMITKTDLVSTALMEDLVHVKTMLSQLYIKGSGGNLDKYKFKFDSLTAKIGRLEADLSRRSADFRRHQDYKKVSASRIASLLSDNSILIEYLKYNCARPNLNDADDHYLAVILDDNGKTDIVELGSAPKIDDLIDRYRQHMVRVSQTAGLPSSGDEQEYFEIARSLYDEIWKPLEVYTANKDLIFVAPDAGLSLISFATLIDGDNKYLIEGVLIHYLSAGRDLIRLHDEVTEGKGLFAIGAPDYNASVEARLTQLNMQADKPADSHSPHGLRNAIPDCEQFAVARVPALPLSLHEIKEIAKVWKSVSSEPVIMYSDADATEDRFKAEAPGHRIIHMATHGYFISDACYQMEGSLPDGWFIGDNPLLLSGLFLAGANLRGKADDSASIEDGILSAYEISAMDFNGTDVVVLSACETGLGSVKEGEGVYGLRRAFQLAGARSVISSLWAISDRHTAKFMSKFYEHRHEILPVRLRQLQLSLINDLRSKGLPDHPVNWGAFIVSGDWQ